MGKWRTYSIIIVFVLFAPACKVKHSGIGYSYVILTRINSNQSAHPFIVIDDCLIEPILQTKVINTVYANSDSGNFQFSQDTAGYQVIFWSERKVVQIDSLRLGFKILNFGKYPQHTKGLKVNFNEKLLEEDVKGLRDTAIGSESYLYSSYIMNDKAREDLAYGAFYWKSLRSSKGFLSIFGESGNLFSCGFSLSYPSSQTTTEIRIASIKNLDRNQLKFYRRIIASAVERLNSLESSLNEGRK